MHRPQLHIRRIREDFLSGREGLSHGTDSVRLGRGKGYSASFGIPNYRIFLKTYLNSSKLIMLSKVMRKNHKRRLQPWDSSSLECLEISGKHMQAGNNPVRGSTERVVL